MNSNTGYKQTTVVYARSKHTGKAIDVNGQLCEVSGRKRAILLLEGFENPRPDLYEVAGYFKPGAFFDGISTRIEDLNACDYEEGLPEYVREPMEERYFRMSDNNTIIYTKDWDTGASNDFSREMYRFNRRTMKVRRIGEYYWQLENQPFRFSNPDTYREYELTDQYVADSVLSVGGYVPNPGLAGMTALDVEMRDGGYGVSITNYSTFGFRVADSRDEIEPMLGGPYERQLFNRAMVFKGEFNDNLVFTRSSSKWGFFNGQYLNYSGAYSTFSVDATAEGKAFLLGLKLYYVGNTDDEDGNGPLEGKTFAFLHTINESNISEVKGRYIATTPFQSMYQGIRWTQLPDGYDYESSLATGVRFLIESGARANSPFEFHSDEFDWDTGWRFAEFEDFFQLMGMSGSLEWDNVYKHCFSSATDPEFPYAGTNVGEDILGSRLTLSGMRYNGAGDSYRFHNYGEQVQYFGSFANFGAKLKFTSLGLGGSNYIIYDHAGMNENIFTRTGFHLSNLRAVREIPDEELGYKLFVNEAANRIDVVSHSASSPAQAPSGTYELPKGLLRGLAVRWMNSTKTRVLAPLSQLKAEIEKTRDGVAGWYGFEDILF